MIRNGHDHIKIEFYKIIQNKLLLKHFGTYILKNKKKTFYYRRTKEIFIKRPKSKHLRNIQTITNSL